tara:strand:- start:1071 stop:1217 length:147 start_codon:yes stop_codon:yes gene_type:complete
MKAKLTKAAKWTNFKIMREKIIEDYIKARRVQAFVKAVHTQLTIKAVL